MTFFTDKDKVLLRSVASIVLRSGGQVPEYILKMKKASRQDKRRLARSSIHREGITKEAREKQMSSKGGIKRKATKVTEKHHQKKPKKAKKTL